MKNNTSSTTAEIFFTTNADPNGAPANEVVHDGREQRLYRLCDRHEHECPVDGNDQANSPRPFGRVRRIGCRLHSDHEYGRGTPTWTFCANESGTCSFTGTKTVRYGSGSTYNTGTYTSSVACTNAIFGDPTPGIAKHCDVDTQGAITLHGYR